MKAFYESRTYNSIIPVSAFVSENMGFVAHWHKDIEMVYVCEGKIGVGINSEFKVLEKGGIAICGSNDIHYYRALEGVNSTIMMIIFRPEMLGTFGYWPDKLLPGSVFLDSVYCSEQKADSQAVSVLHAGFCRIIDEMNRKRDFYPHLTSLELFNLFLTLFRYFPAYFEECNRKLTGSQASQASIDIKPMQKAIRYLEANYTQDITLEQIAEAVNLSRFYFSRLFKKTTGMNFNIYLTRIRIDKAETIINTTGKTILEIAFETGFSSVRTFNRTFKAIKGYTPQSIRKACR